MYRYVLCIIAFLGVVACDRRSDTNPVPVVDLLREFDRAEARPAAGFEIVSRDVDGVTRPALVMPVPGRATFALPLPRRGLFRAHIARDPRSDATASVQFRLGVSDHRIYEGLQQIAITRQSRGWTTLTVDLSAYAGFKWSLFYRPDRIVWRVVLAADQIDGPAPKALWGSPDVVTDVASAKEYRARRHALR